MRFFLATLLALCLSAPAQAVEPKKPREPRKPKQIQTTSEKPEFPNREFNQPSTGGGGSPDVGVRVATPTPAPSVASISERIAAAWPGNDAWALRITRCESINYTDTYNESSGAAGWWQFIPSTWTKVLGQTGDPRDYSVEYQTHQAWRLFQIQGRGAWACD